MDPAPPLPSSTSVNRNNPAKARAKRKAPARATFVTTWNPKPYAGVAFTSGSRPAGIHMNAPSTTAPRAAASPTNPTNRRPTSNGDTGAPVDVGPPGGREPGRFPFASCTPWANDPAVKWPSTEEVADQPTVKVQ